MNELELWLVEHGIPLLFAFLCIFILYWKMVRPWDKEIERLLEMKKDMYQTSSVNYFGDNDEVHIEI